MHQVAKVSRRARVPISAKLGTGSRFWAFVGVLQKSETCGLLFPAFMLYLSKALSGAFWGWKEFLHPPVEGIHAIPVFSHKIRLFLPLFLRSKKSLFVNHRWWNTCILLKNRERVSTIFNSPTNNYSASQMTGFFLALNPLVSEGFTTLPNSPCPSKIVKNSEFSL